MPKIPSIVLKHANQFLRQQDETVKGWMLRRASTDSRRTLSTVSAINIAVTQPALATKLPVPVLQTAAHSRIQLYEGIKDTALGIRGIVSPQGELTRQTALTQHLPDAVKEIATGTLQNARFVATAAPHIPEAGYKMVSNLFRVLPEETWQKQKAALNQLPEQVPKVIKQGRQAVKDQLGDVDIRDSLTPAAYTEAMELMREALNK